MHALQAPLFVVENARRSAQKPNHIVIGITHSQTCLALTGRLRALREAGFRVTLVCSPGELLDRTAAQEGVEVIGLPMEREISPLADVVSLLRLWRLLVRLRPDIAEFSTPKAGLLGGIASLLAGVPARIYMLRGLKLETATGVKRVILLAAERATSACAHVVLCNSPSIRSKALALEMAPTDKIRLLGDGSSNGVNVARFSPGPSDVRARLGIPTGALVVGFVGRLTNDKGIPELIQAFDTIWKREPRAVLLLVGWFDEAEDALTARWKERIGAHPRIYCTGFVLDTAPYYRAMDLMVLPTWREGFPNVVLEAAASGVPVITTESTGSRDSVLHGITGLLVPPGSPEAISGAVLNLLGEPARRRRMGEDARVWVSEHFSDKRVLGLAVIFYKSLLRPRRSRPRALIPAVGLATLRAAAWMAVQPAVKLHAGAKAIYAGKPVL